MRSEINWIPACAGMTTIAGGQLHESHKKSESGRNPIRFFPSPARFLLAVDGDFPAQHILCCFIHAGRNSMPAA